MATEPEKHIDWADDDVVDPISGQNNVVEPPNSKKPGGWVRFETPPRQYFNWLARIVDRWNKWNEAKSEPKTLSGSTTNNVPADGSGHTHEITTATQAQAEAGTNTSGLMTPQRTRQHIDARKSDAIDEDDSEQLATSAAVNALRTADAEQFGFYEEAEVTLTNAGNQNISGSVFLVKYGSTATMYFGGLNHDSAGGLNFPLSEFPSPFNKIKDGWDASNVYEASSSRIKKVLIIGDADGEVIFQYRDYTGSSIDTSLTDSGFISWRLE